MVQYSGFINYCYADATAMFLSAHGIEVSPASVEVLSGISLMGAHRLVEPECVKLYLSIIPTPDHLTRALRMLGIEVEAVSGGVDEGDPAGSLGEEITRTGAVLAGPLDMGHLKYFPYWGHAGGADHYVVAHEVDDVEVHVHDPMGYPFARLLREDFVASWRADAVECAPSPYHRWRSPRRVAEPTFAEVYAAAMPVFEEIRRSTPSGSEVIRAFADDLRADRLNPRSQAFLTVFLLQTEARRGLDYARFFHDGGAADLSAWKLEQSRLFGSAFQAGNKGSWGHVADALDAVAVLEDEVAARPFV